MTKPNADLDKAGWTLQAIVAIQLTAALEHVHRELAALDGFGSGTPEVSVRASSDLTGPERYADARWTLTSAREDLRDAKDDVLRAIRELNEMCNAVIRLRAPKLVVKPEDAKKDLCCSHQSGKHAVIEWGDPLCMFTAQKSGLCQRHYMAWYRARVRDGIDVTKDHEPV